jgi:hypothetical protein
MTSGSILGAVEDMKPVMCAIDANLAGKRTAKRVHAQGNFPDDADFFPRHVLSESGTDLN